MRGGAVKQPKIIAGRWRGRSLATPEGLGTRPTASRGREALFSMLDNLAGGFAGLGVIDLFAGGGGLGLEALSRGAAFALFVENDRSALRALKRNMATFDAAAEILAADAAKTRLAGRRFDLVFADPPYGRDLARPAIAALAAADAVAPDALIALETGEGEAAPLLGGAHTLLRERRVGAARFWIYRAVS